MKGIRKSRQGLVLPMLTNMIAGIMVVLWLAQWFVRLMPRAVGGEGIFAWADLAERTYRLVRE